MPEPGGELSGVDHKSGDGKERTLVALEARLGKGHTSETKGEG